jgi:hypothetical protein
MARLTITIRQQALSSEPLVEPMGLHFSSVVCGIMLPLGSGVYFTAGIAGEDHGLFGIIAED